MNNDRGCVCTDICKIYASRTDEIPEECPGKLYLNVLEEVKKIYREEESDAKKIWNAFAKLLHTGGAKKSRLEHIVDFSHAMDIKIIGIAGCVRYIEECVYVNNIFKEQGLESHIIMCKVGGFKTKDINIDKVTDWTICNPLAQALILNKLNCEINVTLGLCMGQELIFNRYAKGFVTNLIVKEKISEERPRDTINRMIKGEYKLAFHKFREEEK